MAHLEHFAKSPKPPGPFPAAGMSFAGSFFPGDGGWNAPTQRAVARKIVRKKCGDQTMIGRMGDVYDNLNLR